MDILNELFDEMNNEERKSFHSDLKLEIYGYLLEQGYGYMDGYDSAFEQALSAGYTEKELFSIGLRRLNELRNYDELEETEN